VLAYNNALLYPENQRKIILSCVELNEVTFLFFQKKNKIKKKHLKKIKYKKKNSLFTGFMI
jgi:hypothetical protein